MTNAQIIFNEQLELMKDGIIKDTGRTITVETTDGKKETIKEPEPIHTFAVWKQLGYNVKRGEKAKASFKIWKYAKGKQADTDENENDDGTITISTERKNCYMVKAFFFTFEQVEKTSK